MRIMCLELVDLKRTTGRDMGAVGSLFRILATKQLSGVQKRRIFVLERENI
jgi:hypothetical protein